MHLYEYDNIYQITEADYPSSLSYLARDPQFSYHAAGNRTSYAEYVEEGLLRDLDSPLARWDRQMIRGTEPFLDRIRRAYVLTRRADKREQSALARARQLLVYAVCHYCRRAERLMALARRFGLSLGGLTMARDRVAAALRRDKTLGRRWR